MLGTTEPTATIGDFGGRATQRPHLAVFAVGTGSVIGLALGLVSGVVSARALGPAIRGEFLATQTLAGMAAVVLTLGMTQAVVTFRGHDEELVGPLLFQAALAATVGAGLFSALAITGAEHWLDPAGVVGGAALTTGSVLASNAAGLVQRRGQMSRGYPRVRLLPQAVGALAAILLWAVGVANSDVWLLVIGLAIFVPSAAIMFGLLGGAQALANLSVRLPKRELVQQAAGSFVAVIGSQLIYRLDTLLVAIWMPTAKVAFYGVAVSTGAACAAIGQSVGQVTFSRLREISEPNGQRAVLRRSTALALGLSSAVALPLAGIAPIAVRVLYGSAFLPSVGPMRVLVLAAIPLSADFLLVHVLLILGAARSVFRVQLFAAVLTIGLLVVIIPTGLLVPVALVSLGIYSISAMFLYAAATRRIALVGARAVP